MTWVIKLSAYRREGRSSTEFLSKSSRSNAAWPQNGLFHRGQLQEVLKVAPPQLGPQRRGGPVVRPGDHRVGLGGLGIGQVPVLVQRLAQQGAEDGDLHHAGRVEVPGAVQP